MGMTAQQMTKQERFEIGPIRGCVYVELMMVQNHPFTTERANEVNVITNTGGSHRDIVAWGNNDC